MTTQTDHAEISMLVDRFFLVLDERKFAADWTRDFLTDDARMETPLGTSQGAEAIRAAEEALERYDRTQHIASGIITDAAAGAERATASWNGLMTHVHHDATLQERGGDADPLFTGFLRGCPGLQAGEESDSCGAGRGWPDRRRGDPVSTPHGGDVAPDDRELSIVSPPG